MATALEPFQADMAYYCQRCADEGLSYVDGMAEDFAESVSVRVIDGGQSEQQARHEQFSSMHP